MFSKANNQGDKKPVNASRNKVPSIIAENLRIVGNLTSEGDIQIEGVVDGDVSSKKLTVGASATVNGVILGDEVTIAGTVNGQITARAIRLTRTAKVIGDINHDSLSIEAGAFVQGLCKRIDLSRKQLSTDLGDNVGNPAVPGKVTQISS